jgi:hypothetical protein
MNFPIKYKPQAVQTAIHPDRNITGGHLNRQKDISPLPAGLLLWSAFSNDISIELPRGRTMAAVDHAMIDRSDPAKAGLEDHVRKVESWLFATNMVHEAALKFLSKTA